MQVETLGKTGKCGACGWAVVLLDYDEGMEPLHGMYGSMEAEFGLAHCQEARAEGICMLSQESNWTHPGAC